MEDGIVHAVDATGRVDVDSAVVTLREVLARYRKIGVELDRPISLVIESMPIMGATQSTKDGHRLHVSERAVASGMLDGLIAHEIGHMVLAERGHPSHRADVHGRVVESVAVPPGQTKAFLQVAREAINHVEDIYADDLAFAILGDDRAASFFSDWVRNSSHRGRTRWETMANALSVAFSLGNLRRHGLTPEDGTSEEAASFAKENDIPLDDFVDAYASLPRKDDSQTVEQAMLTILRRVADAGRERDPRRK